MKNQDYTNELLGKYFAHEYLTDEQQNEVKIWIENHPEDFKRLDALMNMTDERLQQKHIFDADKAWNKIAPQLKTRQNHRLRTLYLVSAVAATLVLAWFGISNWLTPSETNAYAYLSNQTGRIERHLLPDSSEVMLFPDSEIKYLIAQTKGKRKVTLQGKAFFEVKKAKERPFTVDANQIKVEVTGTSFTVDARKEGLTSVEVRTGRVRVSTENQTVELRHNEKVKVDGRKIQKEIIADPEAAFGFMSKILSVREEKMEDVIQKIEEISGIQIEYDQRIGQNAITARLDLTQPAKALNEIAFLCQCRIEQIDSLHYRLYDKDHP